MKSKSLGLVTTPIAINTPVFTNATASIQASVGAGSGSAWTGILNTISKVTDTVKTIAPAVSNIKNTVDSLKKQTQAITQGSAPMVITNNGNGGGAPTGTGLSTGAKVAIGGVALAVVGGTVFYIVTRKKKSK